MDIGKRIRQVREEKGMSLNQLANRSEIAQPFLFSVEAGKKNISLKNIEKICTALGISLAQFFSDPSEQNDLSPNQQWLINYAKQLTDDEASFVISVIEYILKNRENNTRRIS